MPLITHAARMLEIVARSGSIRKASERVNSASSAVNRQILNLEAEYGTALFTRHPRGMHLTEAGKIVVEQVREWQKSDQHIRAEIEALKGQSGHVKIGIMECFASTFLPRLLQDVQATGENIALDVVVGGTRDIAQGILSGDLDLAIAFNIPSEHGFKTLYEAKMVLGAVMHPDHELAQLDIVPRSELNRFPLVLADQSLTIAPIVRSMLEQSRMSTSATVTSNSVTVIKALLKQGERVSFLTLADVYEEVQRGELHFAPVRKMHMSEVLSISALDGSQMTDASRFMVGAASEALEKIKQEFSDFME